MTQFIYRSMIPADALSSTNEQGRLALSRQSLLEGGSDVTQLGNDPDELSLEAEYRGLYAERLTVEMRELLTRGPDVLSLFDDSQETPLDGYYSAERVSGGRLQPQADSLTAVQATIVREGTRRSDWLSVATSKGQRANDFGSDQTTNVGAPVDASLVRWWDGSTTVSYPSPVATRTAEHGDVDVYDADAAAFENPTLVYQPASYGAMGDVDVKVWDTYGAGSKTDANGVVQWGRVFSPEHDPRSDEALIIENGLLRLTVDDDAETITAEEWDSATSAWSSVSLGASSWVPVDLDIRELAPARVRARLLFSDGTDRYPLDCILTRGDTAALFVRTPTATSATPQGLIDLLTPIATTTIYDSGDGLGLAKRSEVGV